jgi:hypothetical protein
MCPSYVFLNTLKNDGKNIFIPKVYKRNMVINWFNERRMFVEDETYCKLLTARAIKHVVFVHL